MLAILRRASLSLYLWVVEAPMDLDELEELGGTTRRDFEDSGLPNSSFEPRKKPSQFLF